MPFRGGDRQSLRDEVRYRNVRPCRSYCKCFNTGKCEERSRTRGSGEGDLALSPGRWGRKNKGEGDQGEDNQGEEREIRGIIRRKETMREEIKGGKAMTRGIRMFDCRKVRLLGGGGKKLIGEGG